MNTKNLKAYAPKARRQFMDAVAKRAAHFGIYPNEITPVSFQGSTAIIEGNAFTKQQGEQRKLLEKRVEEKGYELFVREMAYTWFNRLAALRYMELHDYLEHGFRVLSHPSNKDGSPEILDHAADVADMLGLDKVHIIEWQLAGDKQEVLYRQLLLGQCHHLHSVMPFLFEAIDDATELLLPDNLTKTDSILKGLVNDIPEEDWQQIEVIGWLYQFYISEHKDAVIGKVVKSEDIPAATQLFTPNWIVKYLVQNSIGRQWLATYPDSSIKAKMEYYIEPAEQTDEVNAQLAAITPSSIDPESIKALDPAAGSGHILVEIYELLREIYLERGYRQREIPELILTKNIYGLDIDDRAAQLAGFALLMKAREDDRRIFQRVQDGSVKLNVYALQSTEGWDSASLWQALNLDGKAEQGSSGDLFAENTGFQQPTGQYAEYFDLLKYLIFSFEQAKTLGSLIQIDHQYLPTLKKFKDELLEKFRGADPAAVAASSQLLPVIEQAIVLAQKYDVVIANPPYMGGKGMNHILKDYLSKNYSDYKADLFSAFMQCIFCSVKKNGYCGLMTPFVWLYLKSFLNLRKKILDEMSVLSIVQPEYHSFFESAYVPIIGICLKNTGINWKGTFFDLKEFNGAEKQPQALKVGIESKFCDFKYLVAQSDFLLMPDSPFAFSLSDKVIGCFKKNKKLSDIATPRQGLATGCNELFLRQWYEVSISKVNFDCDDISNTYDHGKKWFPYNKGGEYRKWYGNKDYVVNWESNGKDIRCFGIEEKGRPRSRAQNTSYYFKPAVSWSKITVGDFSTRLFEKGFAFDVAGCSIFSESTDSLKVILALLNSKLSTPFIKNLAQTINYEVGQIGAFPIANVSNKAELLMLTDKAILIAKSDWDSHESSWGYTRNILLQEKDLKSIRQVCELVINKVKKQITDLKEIEDRLNQLIIQDYDLGEEIDYKVDFSKITHRYIDFFNNQDNNLVVNFLVYNEIATQFLSYVLGCMVGRYSLDLEGLVYAYTNNQDFNELIDKGVFQSFPADEDGIIPLASEDWLFEDDATARFREFVRTVWGAEHLQDNLEFIAESLCLNSIKPQKSESAMETIRRYFSTQFFADHCKMYKKRPIYWLFSSGKEKAFECLVYLHRYNEATLSRMRTEYVTPLMGKYDHQLARKMEEVVEASGAEQRRIEKEIKELEKKQLELRKFDEELKHYAEMRITLDLDDGVKENYGKFGNLLANVKDIHGKVVK